MHGNAGDLLIAAPDDVRALGVRAGLKHCNVPLLNTVTKGDATIFVVRPPADLDPSDLWVACGLPIKRVWEDDFNVDVTDRAALSKRFFECMNGTGMSEMSTPRQIGLNLAGSTVFETIGGRVAVNKSSTTASAMDVRRASIETVSCVHFGLRSWLAVRLVSRWQ